jgi:hypothetical protein
MAHPYTAVTAIVSPEEVNTFLNRMVDKSTSPAGKWWYTSTFVSKGDYGSVFRIDVDIHITFPFKTFYINDQRIIITSDNTYFQATDHIHRFCCKIVSITTKASEFSFTNECIKQRDIYARTNINLNPVCLPLFFYSTVSSEDTTSPLYPFLDGICTRYPDKLVPAKKFGISFMPYSANISSSVQPVMPVRDILNSASVLSAIPDVLPTVIDEPIVIQLFTSNIHIYSFCVVLSLLIRLYLAGYCHGDLHLGNIIVDPCESGMHETNRQFFHPTLLLIDTGLAFRHSSDITLDPLNYENFKLIIDQIMDIRSPRSRRNMIYYEPYSWFPKIFRDGIDNVHMDPTLNEHRCKFIFSLFQYFELFKGSSPSYTNSAFKINGEELKYG